MPLNLSPIERQRWIEHRRAHCHGNKTILETDPERCNSAVRMYRSGVSKNTICSHLRMSPDTLYKILRAKKVI